MAVPNRIKNTPPIRQLKFKTVADMEAAIKTYFDEEKRKCLAVGTPPIYTMSGLALSLGIDRRSLVNYAQRDAYFPAIKEARQRVEESIEFVMLSGKGSAPGCIFAMKNNFDWKDTQYLAGDKDNPLEISLESAIINAKARVAKQ